MSAPIYPECRSCIYRHKEPTICEQCDNGSEFQDDGFGEEFTSYFYEDREIE